MEFLKDLNKEKQDIINIEGNVLVTANPGTGKTYLLSYKYLYLLKKNINPEDILCLTFTEKAKKGLANEILKTIKKHEYKIDFSKIQVHTFHSYALTYLQDNNIASNNLIRYSIYKYFKEKEILNYGDSYLIETIVPKMENLIRYVKTFGIMPDDINLEETRKHLVEHKNYSKEEIDLFVGYFKNTYKYYEDIKNKQGIDYSDMLNNFLKINNIKKFKYVLIDELQDVNTIEADIALKSAINYVAVGDKKQAIFGFQGGSINNFKKFKDAKHFILSENFRSSNPILDYAKYFFINKTKDGSHKEDLKLLSNKQDKYKDIKEKPKIYNIENNKISAFAAESVKDLGTNTAIITRHNSQIVKVSKELKSRGIKHTTTYFSGSKDAKTNIITFLKGIFTNDVNMIKNALFTPFSPTPLQEAFEISDNFNIKKDEILNKCKEFKELRDSVKNIEDVNKLFDKIILPISINYGKEYLMASLEIHNACKEAFNFLDEKSFKNFTDYILSSDYSTNDTESKKDIIITTVHKAKGLEYDNVIYLPKKSRDKTNFQDRVVEAILKTKGIDAKQELEEEALRIDFVAFTRAKKKLIIIPEDFEEYVTEYADQETTDISSIEETDYTERNKKAYNLFISGEYDKAKELISSKNEWLIEQIKAFFENLDRISYSYVSNTAFDYLQEQILKLKDDFQEFKLGSDVHEIAEKILKNEKYEVKEEAKPFVENLLKMIKEIKENYEEVFSVEENIVIPVSAITTTNVEIMFKAKLDAVFKNKKGEYLIVDWKTSKKTDSKHKQQLESYKKAFCAKNNISLDKVNVAVGYIGLRSTINTGRIEYELDNKKPVKKAFETFNKRLTKFLSWKENPNNFFKDLKEEGFTDDPLWRAIIEQYERENERN